MYRDPKRWVFLSMGRERCPVNMIASAMLVGHVMLWEEGLKVGRDLKGTSDQIGPSTYYFYFLCVMFCLPLPTTG